MHPIIGKNILILTAHPDDEAFTAGGTIHANTEAGGTTTLLCASLGGRGKAHLDRELTEEELKQVRFEELHRATGCLGMHAVHVFDFPDGDIKAHTEAIYTQWKPLVTSIKPDLIVSFGPDGYTGHADHIAVGHIAKQLADECSIPRYTFSLPTGELEHAFKECLQKKQSHGVYEVHNHIHTEDSLCIHVQPERKLEALKHHASQFGGLDPYRVFPQELAEHFLSHEYFKAQ
jgi:LmbE family N-acetylglucosaminyl deacetylase